MPRLGELNEDVDVREYWGPETARRSEAEDDVRVILAEKLAMRPFNLEPDTDVVVDARFSGGAVGGGMDEVEVSGGDIGPRRLRRRCSAAGHSVHAKQFT
jgi:hypothetical protein